MLQEPLSVMFGEVREIKEHSSCNGVFGEVYSATWKDGLLMHKTIKASPPSHHFTHILQHDEVVYEAFDDVGLRLDLSVVDSHLQYSSWKVDQVRRRRHCFKGRRSSGSAFWSIFLHSYRWRRKER